MRPIVQGHAHTHGWPTAYGPPLAIWGPGQPRPNPRRNSGPLHACTRGSQPKGQKENGSSVTWKTIRAFLSSVMKNETRRCQWTVDRTGSDYRNVFVRFEYRASPLCPVDPLPSPQIESPHFRVCGTRRLLHNFHRKSGHPRTVEYPPPKVRPPLNFVQLHLVGVD